MTIHFLNTLKEKAGKCSKNKAIYSPIKFCFWFWCCFSDSLLSFHASGIWDTPQQAISLVSLQHCPCFCQKLRLIQQRTPAYNATINCGRGWAAMLGFGCSPSSFIAYRVPVKPWCHFRSAAKASSPGKSSERTFRERTLAPWFFAFTFLRWGHMTDLLLRCISPAVTLKIQHTLPVSQQQQAPMRKDEGWAHITNILWSCVSVCVSV